MSKENTSAQQQEGFRLKEWAMADAAVYDRLEVYNQEIRPLADKLLALCIEHKIPMHYVACFSQEADGSNHCHGNSNMASIEECPAEILVHAMPPESLSEKTVRRVNAVVAADQVRIERFYANSERSH